jgi:DNA-directed RNA polymerase specialized sigma24 family protein
LALELLSGQERHDCARRLLVDALFRPAASVLSRIDREALLLVAWEDLTPSEAAQALGINRPRFASACCGRAGDCRRRSRQKS